MAISGNLRTMPFADLMQWIAMSRKTGILVIKGPVYTKKILFHHGTVSAVTSNNPREHLGYYLVGWGYLTEDELSRFLEEQRQVKVMLGELLVRAGRLPRAEVDRVVRIKTEQTIYDLILWQEGEFFLLDETQPRRDFHELALTVDHFIFEGARQADERRRMRELVPDNAHVPVLTRAATQAERDSGDGVVIDQIDGKRTIEEIGLACRTPEFDVLAAVYRGVSSGLIRLESASGQHRPPPGTGHATWRDVLREAETSMALGDLLEAYRHVVKVREMAPHVAAAHEAADRLEKEIEREVAAVSRSSSVILEPTTPVEQLTQLNLGRDEAFVFSRINGFYTLPQVLTQLPGQPIYNLLIIHSLLQRGVIKTRESQAVAKYAAPRNPDPI